MTYQRQVTFQEAITRAFNNYCNFSGRASRSEYWWFYLFSLLLGIVIGWIGALAGSDTLAYVLTSVMGLALFLPSFGLLFRRLHDAGHSGWWWLLSLTGIGAIVVLVFLLMPSQPFTNKYGEVPNLAET